MKHRRIRRGAANTSTIVIIVVVVVVVVLLAIGCLGAVIVGIMAPAIAQARDAARTAMSAAQLVQIDTNYEIWRRDAGDDAPFTFDALVDANYATRDLFVSPVGPAPDGEDYWYLHPRPDRDAPGAGDIIIGYDRALYAAHPRVAVLFGNGRADVIDIADFEQLLRAPPNDQVDFNLPRRQSAR